MDNAIAAAIMGMKPNEVVEVRLAADARWEVRTHDGVWTCLPAALAVVVCDEDETVDDSPTDAGGEDDEVPDANAPTVLAWVGGDRDLAKRALDVELRRDTPRAGLTAALQKIVAAD